MHAEYIKKKADEILRLSGGRDPFEAAEITGAKISYKDLGSLKGAYFGTFSVPVIVISDSLDENMRRVVCAHELGHHILHSGNIQSCTKICFDSGVGKLEREANIFAAAFLIDYDKAAEYLSDGYSFSQTAAFLETDLSLLKFLLSVFGYSDTPSGNFLK